MYQDEIARNLLRLLKDKIREIDGTFKLEVACCEGNTCTVTEQTTDILKALLEAARK